MAKAIVEVREEHLGVQIVEGVLKTYGCGGAELHGCGGESRRRIVEIETHELGGATRRNEGFRDCVGVVGEWRAPLRVGVPGGVVGGEPDTVATAFDARRGNVEPWRARARAATSDDSREQKNTKRACPRSHKKNRPFRLRR